jgi:hypothetical protein
VERNKEAAAPVVLDKWKDSYELQKSYSSDGCSYREQPEILRKSLPRMILKAAAWVASLAFVQNG